MRVQVFAAKTSICHHLGMARFYDDIEIDECGDPLVPIPNSFAFVNPHPYIEAGAPYGDTSPWMIRKGALIDLMKCKRELLRRRPGSNILLFDVYRINAVQDYMIKHEAAKYAKRDGLIYGTLGEQGQQHYIDEALKIFATPSMDPKTPPPHSTGGTIDCTLIDEYGNPYDMGSDIDENSDRSFYNHFGDASDVSGREAHANRALLRAVMRAGDFYQNEREWWHYDNRRTQRGVYARRLINPRSRRLARYGNAEFLPPSPKPALVLARA